jgi:hypothetical protein
MTLVSHGMAVGQSAFVNIRNFERHVVTLGEKLPPVIIDCDFIGIGTRRGGRQPGDSSENQMLAHTAL